MQEKIVTLLTQKIHYKVFEKEHNVVDFFVDSNITLTSYSKTFIE